MLYLSNDLELPDYLCEYLEEGIDSNGYYDFKTFVALYYENIRWGLYDNKYPKLEDAHNSFAWYADVKVKDIDKEDDIRILDKRTRSNARL